MPDSSLGRSVASIYSVNDRPAWSIQVCDCGCPLGAVLVAIAIKKCPDCGRSTIPVENVTTRVWVVEADDA